MESTGTNKSKTVRSKKQEIHCIICGSVVGKISQGEAAFRCPRCKVDIDVDQDQGILTTRTTLKD